MGFFRFFASLIRILVFYFLFDFFQHEEFFQFLILLLSVISDIYANFNVMAVFLFVIFSIVAFFDVLMSKMTKSIVIIVYNAVLIWDYSCHPCITYKMEKKKSMRTYLNKLENCTDETNECYICLENCKERSNLKILPCSHLYHTECLLKWFDRKKNTVCPVCKQEVITMDKIIVV